MPSAGALQLRRTAPAFCGIARGYNGSPGAAVRMTKLPPAVKLVPTLPSASIALRAKVAGPSEPAVIVSVPVQAAPPPESVTGTVDPAAVT